MIGLGGRQNREDQKKRSGEGFGDVVKEGHRLLHNR